MANKIVFNITQHSNHYEVHVSDGIEQNIVAAMLDSMSWGQSGRGKDIPNIVSWEFPNSTSQNKVAGLLSKAGAVELSNVSFDY